MKVLKTEKRFCTCCMEEHEVKTVLFDEQVTFKNSKVSYEAMYLYCDMAEELYSDELLLQKNDIALKNAYRVQEGLLTSQQIIDIRAKYEISQSDLCTLLGWGGKTIARYETHQIQDKAHDSILKKISVDPEWFLSLLNASKESFSNETYKRYYDTATSLYENDKDGYLKRTIEALYAKYQGLSFFNGNTALSLDKFVDVTRYFASSNKVTSLYKVKLMKLLWYADALSYKLRGHTITGLVYMAFPMGALPIGHHLLIDLNNVPCEEVDIGTSMAYHFSLDQVDETSTLTEEDKDVLNVVIDKLGNMNKNEIINYMHKEQAYIQTEPRSVISFEYAKELQI